jgi:glycosyltransferase involved in cell wall biosynthesis
LIDASVIVCVRNGAKTIDAQLTALAAQECSLRWELVVVDNGSTDQTLEVVEQWRERLPGLRVIHARSRTGLAYARNVGARSAEGEILAFCDADDVADRRWLTALLAGIHTAELVGGRLQLEPLNSEMARWWRGLSDDDLCRATALGYLQYAVGANFAVRRDAFEAVGGCDEAFSVCGDDIDLSWRIQRAGGVLGFRDDAVMHYRLREDLRGLMRQRYFYGRTEALLRLKFGDAVPAVDWHERWPTYRYLVTRSWHLLGDTHRRGGWLSAASYCAGRIGGSARYHVVAY